MIKVAIEGAREFGSARVKFVLTFSAEAACVTRLVAVVWFTLSLIDLGARESTVFFISTSVITSASLAITSIFSRRRVGIV